MKKTLIALAVICCLSIGIGNAANDYYQTLNVGNLNVFQKSVLKGPITNTGNFTNVGAMTNTGAFSNTGTMSNTGNVNFVGTLANSGLITATSGMAAKSTVSISSNTTTSYVCSYLGAVSALPTSTYKECSTAYLISDHKMYVATESVVGIDSWVAMH